MTDTQLAISQHRTSLSLLWLIAVMTSVAEADHLSPSASNTGRCSPHLSQALFPMSRPIRSWCAADLSVRADRFRNVSIGGLPITEKSRFPARQRFRLRQICGPVLVLRISRWKGRPELLWRPLFSECIVRTTAESTRRRGAPGNNIGQPEGCRLLPDLGQWQPLHQSSNMADVRSPIRSVSGCCVTSARRSHSQWFAKSSRFDEFRGNSPPGCGGTAAGTRLRSRRSRYRRDVASPLCYDTK